MTKKIKVFYGNQHVKHIRVNTTRKISVKSECKRIALYVSKLLAVLSLVSISLASVIIMFTEPVQIVSAQVKTVMPDMPVLDRIAKCESNDQQYNAQGQVLIHPNTNGTYDQGEYQINSIWNAKATKLGYDLTKSTDNKAFAQYLFVNYGSSAWTDSSKCWNK